MAEKRDILAEARDWWISYCTNIAELLEYADLMNIRDSDVVRNRLSELQRMNDPNVYEPAPPNPYEGRDILQEAIQWYVNYCTNSQELIDYAEDMGIRNSELVNSRLFDVRNPYGLEFLETSYTDINDLMDSQSESVEYRVNSFDSAEELMNYAAVMGIQESPTVINRLRHLQRPDKYNDSLGAIVESFAYYTGGSLITLGDKSSSPPFNDVRTTDISQESDYICFTNDETMENSEIIEDDEPLAGTSHHHGKLNFTMREKSKRTYKKYMAVDTCYEVKIDEQYNGQNLMDIQEGLEDLLETVLERARGDLADNDLVRVIIEHQALQDAIVVPLQRWDELTVQKLLEHIMRVLNSNQQLTIDHSFTIFIGTINLPKGGKRRRITNIAGKKRKNSLHLKRSVVTIENKDNLCMARAIGVSWSKLNKCSQLEWNAIASNRQGKSNLELILEHKMVPRSYFSKLIDKKRQAQTKLALALCQKAGVNTQHPLSLNDVEAFEKLLGVRVMVVSARLGNKFVTSGASDERPCIYIYLVDDEHFHAITSITGFFSSIYFCQKCLKHYNEKKKHSCEIKCIVCKRDSCSMKESVRCSDCNMTCRSADCYIEHKKRPVTKKGPHKGKPCGPSQCSTWWKCPACCKVVDLRNRSKESHVCGEYWCESCNQFVFDDHQCYLRPIPCKEEHIPKFIFFDFECSQDEKSFCEDGYLPSRKADCQHCKLPDLCQSCSKCSHCKTPWCGKNTHRPNFVVAHTVCQKCIEKDVKPNSRCKSCGTRCEICEKTDEKKSIDPCPDTCGFREVIFQGSDTAEKFGEWLFSDQHEYFTVIAHTMRAYDGFPLLEYLINQSIRPEKVIYNGCKIMLLMAERGLHIKVLDSLNFLPMKLAKLPEAFGLTELKKGWFPHFFNTRENQNYVGPYPAAKYYGADSMSNKERGKLIRWLKAKRRKNCIFHFREEMEEYCRSDVDILRKACLKVYELRMKCRARGKI